MVITGASRGLGRAVAIDAARRGARLGLIARSADALAETLRLAGGRGVVAPCDVGDASGVRAAIASVVDELGGIDVLVCCAGVGAHGPFATMPSEEIDELVRTNALGTLYAVHAALPSMLDARGGHIALVGSIAGHVGVPLEAAYSASKSAVVGLGEALGAELRADGIAVSVVNHGPIATDFFATRGRPYTRRWPRPMPVQRASRAVIRAVEAGRTDVVVPRWLRAAPVVSRVAPSLYRGGAARALADEIRARTSAEPVPQDAETSLTRNASPPRRTGPRGRHERTEGEDVTIIDSQAARATDPSSRDPEVDRAALADLTGELAARAAAENFHVAPRFLPRPTRDDLMSLYGFARLVDWIGDEYDGDRSAALDWAERCLERAAAGESDHPLFERVGQLVVRRNVPLQPLRDLIEANRRDQVVHRYATFDDLLGYCALSANPVGRSVLAVLDLATPQRIAWSDDVCSALQLAEHWQDVREDAHAGRVYLPADDLARFGVDEDELVGSVASPQLRSLMLHEVRRARRLLDSGDRLVASVHGRTRLLIAGFVAGGHAALDAVERAGGDVLRATPRASRTRIALRTAGVTRRARRVRAAR